MIAIFSDRGLAGIACIAFLLFWIVADTLYEYYKNNANDKF